jgi:hypothetical protein
MVDIVTKGSTGWVAETPTFPYAVRDLTNGVNTNWKAFGRTFGTPLLPSEKYNKVTQPTGSSFDYNNYAFQKKDVEFDFPFFLDDAREIYFPFGKNTDTSPNQILTFDSSGYTDCISTDIGKAVVGGTTGDSGTLVNFDNTLRKWTVLRDASDDLFDQAEAITITSGTGAGTTSGASSVGYVHTITQIEPSDAFTLPSRTIHTETRGLTNNKFQDIAGGLVKEAEWKIALGDSNGLMQTNKIGGQRITDELATTNLYGVTSNGSADLEGSTGGATSKAVQYNEYGIRLLTFDAVGYTNAVSSDLGKAVVGTTTTDSGILLDYDNTLRQWTVSMDAADDLFDVAEAITITAGTGAGTTAAGSSDYKNPSPRIGNDQAAFLIAKKDDPSATGITIGGIDLTPYWQALGLKVVNTFKDETRSQRAGKTNYNISISQYKQGDFLESRSHFIALTMDFSQDVSSNFLADIMTEVLTKQAIITFQKHGDTTETIVFTYNATVNPMEKYEFPNSQVDLSTAPIVVSWNPKSLVSVVKYDSFATLL